MRQSLLFTKTQKNLPGDEQSKNAQFLIKAGFIDKLTAGVYTYLPLGLKVLDKIEEIIREEMNSLGSNEVLMPALHSKENWEVTNRWGEDVMYKVSSQTKKEYGLGWTHEEIVTPLVKKFASSYKDLPVAVYQIQTKFRDELRAKSGILRGREFRMKDLYSFHKDEKDLDYFYDKVTEKYYNVFRRVGIGEKTYLTYASGGAFSKYSHEFQTLTDSGEDEIYLCPSCKVAVNKEIIEDLENKCPVCSADKLEQHKAIEVGNIFKLKNRFSESFNYKYTDSDGQQKDVMMGCYGIGPSRVMGTVVELLSDENGIAWPFAIAPFHIHLIKLDQSDKKVEKEAELVYKELTEAGYEVLYDDRDMSNGEKLKDSDLIGLPIRIIISPKTLQNNQFELKLRDKDSSQMISKNDLNKQLNKIIDDLQKV